MLKRVIFSCLCLSTLGFSAGKPCSQPDYKQFDFWLGSWTVKTKDNKIAGRNVIKKVNPCLILETWAGAKGSTGSSINYFNPTNKQWVQHWVGGDGTIIHLAGPAKGQSIAMTGTIFYAKNQKTLPFKGTWTLNKDATVRQYFEQQDPKSGKWQPWFEGIYSKNVSKDKS